MSEVVYLFSLWPELLFLLGCSCVHRSTPDRFILFRTLLYNTTKTSNTWNYNRWRWVFFNQRPLLNSLCTSCYSSPGWTLVFKVVSGVDKEVWDLYNSDQASAEYEKAALDVTNQHQDHYKNRVVMNWQTFNASQVKIEKHAQGRS